MIMYVDVCFTSYQAQRAATEKQKKAKLRKDSEKEQDEIVQDKNARNEAIKQSIHAEQGASGSVAGTKPKTVKSNAPVPMEQDEEDIGKVL